MKLTLAKSTELTERIVTPMITLADSVSGKDLEYLEECLKSMRDKTSTQRAFPFPQSQDAADENDAKNILFKAILDVIKTRKKTVKRLIELNQGKQNMDNFLERIL